MFENDFLCRKTFTDETENQKQNQEMRSNITHTMKKNYYEKRKKIENNSKNERKLITKESEIKIDLRSRLSMK